MAFTMVVENHNYFLDVGFMLSFHWIDVTLLCATVFVVLCNGSWPLQYNVQVARSHSTPTRCRPLPMGRRKGRKRK